MVHFCFFCRLKQFVLHKSGNFVKVTNASCGKALEEIS